MAYTYNSEFNVLLKDNLMSIPVDLSNADFYKYAQEVAAKEVDDVLPEGKLEQLKVEFGI